MKKLMTLALTTLAVVAAQAANINWSTSGNATTYAYEKDGTTLTSGTVYLVLADDLSSITGKESQKDFEKALAALTLDSSVSTSGGVKPSVTKKLVSSDKLVDGQSTTFGILTYCVDSDGNGWYHVGTATSTPWADGTPSTAQKTVTTPWAKLASDTYKVAWTAPQPIPEPATGALALAGVALLFRRRRA